MKSVWRRTGNIAVPIGEQSIAALHSHADGSEFIAQTKGVRNVKQLKMFWALCDILADNCKDIYGKEQAKKSLLWSLNYIEPFMDLSSKRIRFETKSIAIESMPQDEFNEFFQSAIQLTCEWLGTAPAEVRKRVAEITDPARGHQWR